MTSTKDEQINSQPQDSENITIDACYKDLLNEVSEVILDRLSQSKQTTEADQSSTLGETMTVDLNKVINEHKAKMKDLISQKMYESLKTNEHLRV